MPNVDLTGLEKLVSNMRDELESLSERMRNEADSRAEKKMGEIKQSFLAEAESEVLEEYRDELQKAKSRVSKANDVYIKGKRLNNIPVRINMCMNSIRENEANIRNLEEELVKNKIELDKPSNTDNDLIRLRSERELLEGKLERQKQFLNSNHNRMKQMEKEQGELAKELANLLSDINSGKLVEEVPTTGKDDEKVAQSTDDILQDNENQASAKKVEQENDEDTQKPDNSKQEQKPETVNNSIDSQETSNNGTSKEKPQKDSNANNTTTQRKLVEQLLIEMRGKDNRIGLGKGLFNRDEVLRIVKKVNSILADKADYQVIIDIVKREKQKIIKGESSINEARKSIDDAINEYCLEDLDKATAAMIMPDEEYGIIEPLFNRHEADQILDSAEAKCDNDIARGGMDYTVIISIVNECKREAAEYGYPLDVARKKVKAQINDYCNLLNRKESSFGLSYDLVNIKQNFSQEEYEYFKDVAYNCRDIADIRADWVTKLQWKFRDVFSYGRKEKTLALPEPEIPQVSREENVANDFEFEMPKVPESMKQVIDKDLSRPKTNIIDDLSKDESDGMSQRIQQATEQKIKEIYEEARRQAEKAQEDAIKAINIAKNSSPYYRENESDDIER